MIIHLQSKRWKDVENRTWTTTYRGPLLIHASSTLTREEFDDACFRAISDGWARRAQLPQFTDVDAIRGQLIGAVQLSNVAPPGDPVSPWHSRECFGWQLSNRVAFAPRPIRGRLSLFEVDPLPSELAALQAAAR
jgi:hypothetical protein